MLVTLGDWYCYDAVSLVRMLRRLHDCSMSFRIVIFFRVDSCSLLVLLSMGELLVIVVSVLGCTMKALRVDIEIGCFRV